MTPPPQAKPETLGVYVHFPWCLKKCPYCDFLSLPGERSEIPHAEYADAVISELERRGESLPALPIHSIFFGGGTPSLWRPAELGRVLRHIRRRFPAAASGVEITAECNPSSFDAFVAEALLAAGINRISLGVQSLDGERLAFLGRLHDAEQGLTAVRTALRSGFERVSADLIFGVAGQAPAAARDEALVLADLGLSHLSAYALTIESGTQFGELARRGRLPLLPEDSVAESFEAVERALESRGLGHYEISNYARPGHEARHNLGYWRGEPYLGLGVGAWGTLRRDSGWLRYRNTPAIERYLKNGTALASAPWDAEGPLVASAERISPEIALSERLMLGLRLEEGVDVESVQAETGAELWTAPRRRAADKWMRRGALELRGSRLVLNKDRWLLADGVLRDLL